MNDVETTGREREKRLMAEALWEMQRHLFDSVCRSRQAPAQPLKRSFNRDF